MAVSREQRLSKALLGSQYRVLIAAALDRTADPISAQTLADRTDIRYPRVQQELKHLLAAEMLVEVESPGRAVLYRKVESSYWSMCSGLLDEWT